MDLLAKLDRTRGESQHIIAVFLDIRGFSAFSQNQDSVDVGVFISQAFKRVIEDYFPFANFCKSTGDGLLVTVPFSDIDSLTENATAVVSAALRCVEEFPSICSENPLVNFECPQNIGIGISRGAACCLVADDEIVDYSGHRLNLAARLMDLARPRGVVLDGNFGLDILPPEIQAKFETTEVFIRSLAEEKSVAVHLQREIVEIPEYAKRPLKFEQWTTIPALKKPATLKEWKALLPRYKMDLPGPLKRPDGVVLRAAFQSFRGGKPAEIVHYSDLTSPEHYVYVEKGTESYIIIHVQPAIVDRATRLKLPLRASITLSGDYVPSP